MALTPTTFVIAPNAIDNHQRLSDPDGTFIPPADVDPVTNPVFTNTTDSAVTVEWDHDEVGIAGYLVQVWVVGTDSDWDAGTQVGLGTKTFTETGVDELTLVRFRIYARTASNDYSEPLYTEDTTLPTVPIEPEVIDDVYNVQFTSVTHDEITVTWDHTGVGIDSYFVRQWIVGVDTDWDAGRLVMHPTQSYTVSGIDPITLVRFAISAHLQSSGDSSNAVTVETTTLEDPGNPEPDVIEPVTSFTIDDNSHSYQVLSWDHSTVDIDGYALYKQVAGDTEWAVLATIDKDTKTYTSSGLPADTLIKYRIYAGTVDPDAASDFREVQGTTDEQPDYGGGDTALNSLTYFNNFEQYSNGQGLQGNDGFDECENFTCDTGKAYAGTRSGHTWIADGDTGFGRWGYGLHTARAREGSEVWWRMAVYWPSWSNPKPMDSSPYLKQFRKILRRITDSDNGGSMEHSIRNDGSLRMLRQCEYGNNVPGTDDNKWVYDYPGITLGGWTMIESYTKFSTSDSGGENACWINGTPVGRVTCQTLGRGSGYELKHYYMGTNWNGGAPGYQEQWYDQLAIAIEGPTNQGNKSDLQYLDTDSNGYPFIGMATG